MPQKTTRSTDSRAVGPPSTEELPTRLRLAIMRLARRLRQQAEPDLTPSMLSAMANIEYRQPVTLGQLAEAERVTPPTMSKIVGRLEDAKLVTRTVDPDDKRIQRLSLSHNGVKLIARNRSRKNAYLARKLRKLDPEEVAVLEEAVGVIEKILEDK
ncbi:MAG: MarR family transcriptional regulator [Actinobacteria bacterium]|nr:MarR family transcriptional regulator [Actinomycetota bacterium]